MYRKKIFILIVISLVYNTIEVSAQKIYKTNWKQTGIIFCGGTLMFGAGLFIEDSRKPFTSNEINLLKSESISSFDKGALGNFSSKASATSDLFRDGVWFAPLTLFLSNQGRENTKEILMMYTEVFSLNAGFTLFTKAAFGRYRPYSYNPTVDLEFKLNPTTRRSFFSGHVSQVASMSFFTATIFDDLYPDSKFKYLVWMGAISAPAITGYLRVKAGRHFPTDVIVGYGVGALIGYFIPELHKISKEKNITIIGAENGLGLIYSF